MFMLKGITGEMKHGPLALIEEGMPGSFAQEIVITKKQFQICKKSLRGKVLLITNKSDEVVSEKYLEKNKLRVQKRFLPFLLTIPLQKLLLFSTRKVLI